MKRLAYVLALGVLLAGGKTRAQWVQFADETATRLVLGSGVLADESILDPPPPEKDIAIGDLNRDGWMDVVIVRKARFKTAGVRQDILLTNDNGILRDQTATLAPGFLSTHTDARDVFIGELTGDDWPDLVIATTFGQAPRFYRNLGNDPTTGAWRGLADETATRLETLTVPADLPVLQFCAVWAGDLTGDGAPDLFFSNYRRETSSGPPAKDILMVNDGSGTYANATDSRLGDRANVSFGTGVELHDMD